MRDTTEWARTHEFGGRIIGSFVDAHTHREMVVIMTMDGPEIALRTSLIPLSSDEAINGLSYRIESLLKGAIRAGYTNDDIRAAIERALQRKEAFTPPPLPTHHSV